MLPSFSSSVNPYLEPGTSSSKKGTSSSKSSKKGTSNRKNNKKRRNRKKSDNNKEPSTPKEVQQPEPPAFGEDHFPSLLFNNSNKVELDMDEATALKDRVTEEEDKDVEDDDYDEEERKSSSGKAMSDAASTATMTSSSSSSESTGKKGLVGGYAAALLKAAPASHLQPKFSEPVPAVETKKIAEMGLEDKLQAVETSMSDESQPQQEEEEEVATPMVITPPAWGGGKSFADVLK